MSIPVDSGQFRRLRGVLRLAEAAAEARAARVDAWQLATPIEVLRSHAGLTNADIRLLIRHGFVQHRTETTKPRAKKRTFRRDGRMNPAARACFILTVAGAHLANRLIKAGGDGESPHAVKPKWDAASGEWTLRGALVKRLRPSADAQRAVLAQCALQDWTGEIDNPFTHIPAENRCHYLGQVLAHLNSSQREAHVHLSSVKKGRKLVWKEG